MLENYPHFYINPNLNELCDFKSLPPKVLFTASLSQIDHLCQSHNQLKLPHHQDLLWQQKTSAPSMNSFQTKSEAAETFCNVLTPTLSLSLAPPARLIRESGSRHRLSSQEPPCRPPPQHSPPRQHHSSC